MVKEITLSEINEGDVIVHNDPYRGGLHTPEHTMFKPIFVDGELMGFAVAIGHFVEVGGMVPGGFPGEATEIFHEGLRVPPVKIKKRGDDVVEVWKLMLANVRTPRQNYGDIRAMISAVDLGEARLKELIGKYGRETFHRTVTDLMDYSEARMRAEIGAFPDGCYRFEDGLRGRRHRGQGVHHPLRGACAGRRGGDRLHRLLVPGPGAHQRHPGRCLVGLLQRHAASHRPDNPQELRLLPPDPGHRPCRHRDERELSGLRGRRQYRDPPAHRRHHPRRDGAGRRPIA